MKRNNFVILLAAALLTVLLIGCVPDGPQSWTPVHSVQEYASSNLPEIKDSSHAPTTEIPTESLSTEPPSSKTVSTEFATEPVIVTVYSSEIAAETVEPTAVPERAGPTQPENTTEADPEEDSEVSYVANKNTRKFHIPTCSSVTDMKESNKLYFFGSRDELIEKGYEPCKRCKP